MQVSLQGYSGVLHASTRVRDSQQEEREEGPSAGPTRRDGPRALHRRGNESRLPLRNARSPLGAYLPNMGGNVTCLQLVTFPAW